MTLEQILAKNLTALMARMPDVETIAKLASRSGVGKGTVERVKKAEVSTSIATVAQLASALGVEPIWLLTSHDDPVGALSAPQASVAPPAMQIPSAANDPLKLTCETPHELRMLSVYRLSGPDNRELINLAVNRAAMVIGLPATLNERQ